MSSTTFADFFIVSDFAETSIVWLKYHNAASHKKVIPILQIMKYYLKCDRLICLSSHGSSQFIEFLGVRPPTRNTEDIILLLKYGAEARFSMITSHVLIEQKNDIIDFICNPLSADSMHSITDTIYKLMDVAVENANRTFIMELERVVL